MQFKEFDWLSGHYIMPYKYGKRVREVLAAFLFPFQSSFPQYWGLSIISYPTRTRGIIVNYVLL